MKAIRVLTVAGSDSGGGAGIQADLKTISALGGFGMTVITALTAQNTLGVQGVYEIPVDFIEKQFDSVVSDIGVDAVKTGMISSADIIRTVARKIRQYGIEKLVVDPVMVAKGGGKLLRDDARETLIKELLPLALVVTPNIPEAQVLTGMGISNVDDMRNAAAAIHKLGVRHVVVKGGHLAGDALDLLYDGKTFHPLSSPRIDTRHTHGTGCTFASAIATELAKGRSVQEAVTRAKIYVTETIRHGFAIGGGQGPTNHYAPLIRQCERYSCIEELKNAIGKLRKERVGNIIPEVQSNFGYALPFAVSDADVAAVPGRIVRVGEQAEALHDPAFGASRHIARVILAVMSFDVDYRSAMNICFSEEVLDALRTLGYRMASFDRADEPPDVKAREGSSLEWGTVHALKRFNGVPDAVFDRGDIGKEPMIRVLGRNPAEVAEKVLRVSKALRK